jgi:hypothetical protein
MKRVGVLPEFCVWMVEHFRESYGDFVKEVVPNSIGQDAAS